MESSDQDPDSRSIVYKAISPVTAGIVGVVLGFLAITPAAAQPSAGEFIEAVVCNPWVIFFATVGFIGIIVFLWVVGAFEVGVSFKDLNNPNKKDSGNEKLKSAITTIAGGAITFGMVAGLALLLPGCFEISIGDVFGAIILPSAAQAVATGVLGVTSVQ